MNIFVSSVLFYIVWYWQLLTAITFLWLVLAWPIIPHPHLLLLFNFTISSFQLECLDHLHLMLLIWFGFNIYFLFVSGALVQFSLFCFLNCVFFMIPFCVLCWFVKYNYLFWHLSVSFRLCRMYLMLQMSSILLYE